MAMGRPHWPLFGQVIMNDLAQAKGQVGLEMPRGNDFQHGQFRDRCQGVPAGISC